MYNFISKKQDENSQWIYNVLIYKLNYFANLKSNDELTEEQLNNLVSEYLDTYENDIEYSTYIDILKENKIYYDRYGNEIIEEILEGN